MLKCSRLLYFRGTGSFSELVKLTSRPNYSRAPIRRAPATQAPRLVLWLALIAIIVVGAWYVLRSRGVDGAIRRGLSLLQGAQSAAEVDAALAQWEREYGAGDRRDEIITAMLERFPLSDLHVRELLVHVAGADYGDRADDWKRWRESRRHLRLGEQPKLQAGERIKLEKRWEAPVGLTAWFSTIISLDGRIYVSSLGAGFDVVDDEADGVVRVDGASGASEYIFRPLSRRGSDIVGIAAGANRLFVASRGGAIYAIDLDGGVIWEAAIDGIVFSPPLSMDVNRDGMDDAVIATRTGRIVALSGANGKPIWSLGASRRPGGRGSANDEVAAAATLAAGHIASDSSPDILAVFPDATLRILLSATGAPRLEQTERAGFLAGSVVCGNRPAGAPRAYIADREARIWSLTRAERKVDLVPTWMAAQQATVIAVPRTIDLVEGNAPAVLACTSGAARGGGAVSLLDATGVRWRYVVDGAVWSTPVVANLSREREKDAGRREIVVCSVVTDLDGQQRGVLLVLSMDGHVLRTLDLPAPADAAPLICDIDGDQKLDLLIADRAGMLHCYATEGVGPVEWGSFLGDTHNTSNSVNAYSFGQTPFGYQARWRPGF
ncbi:MAG: PQQ-binding-like beta-propeller repeat protein [Phycisphaerales bacterium]|nr:PQQ-binding-like beta-propeller repeat protein [Phycisphaerales bacterium]